MIKRFVAGDVAGDNEGVLESRAMNLMAGYRLCGGRYCLAGVGVVFGRPPTHHGILGSALDWAGNQGYALAEPGR